VTEGDYGVHAGGSEGGEEAGDDADQGQDGEGDQHRAQGGMKDDVAFVVGCFVHGGVERHRGDEVGGDEGDDHAGGSGEEGEDEAFDEELGEDVAAPGAEGLHEADLSGALGDGDQHDVHDADTADGEGHGSDDAEKDLKGEGEGDHLFAVFDGVPDGEGFFVFGVEVVTLGEDGADGLDGAEVDVGGGGLEDDGVGVALLAEGAHGVEGDEDVFVVGAVVGGVLDFVAEDADDGEGLAFDLDDFADGRVAVEELLGGVGAEDDDLAVVGEVGGLEEAALVDVEAAHAAVGKVDGFGLDGDDFGAVFDAEGVVDFAGDGGEEGQGVADGFHVAVEEADLLAGALAAGLHGGLTSVDHDDVVAEAHEALHDAGSEGAAVAEEKDDGDQAPDDAEHGEAGAQAVAAEGLDGLGEGFGELHKGKE
jgi:hypothetical protein